MLGIIFIVVSIASLILEKYVLGNNSHAIIPFLAIAFIVGMMLTNNMKFDVFNIILAVVYVSLSFIFWGQGSDLYHQKVVNKIYE